MPFYGYYSAVRELVLKEEGRKTDCGKNVLGTSRSWWLSLSTSVRQGGVGVERVEGEGRVRRRGGGG